jgi:SMC interacting uncharacterized protein involved in chromosome segregation
MSYDVYLLLIGTGIGLVSSILGAFVQHVLSLRAERKKREWEGIEKAREDLLRGVYGVTERQIQALQESISGFSLQTSGIRKSQRHELHELMVAAMEELGRINEQIEALREEVRGREGIKGQNEASDYHDRT